MPRHRSCRPRPHGSRRLITLGAACLGLGAAAPLPAADLIVQGPNSPYAFSGGTAAYDNIYVGQATLGILNQSGGTLSATTGQLFLGGNMGSIGTYNLSGGTLNTISTDVGDSGTGVFMLSGGGVHNVTGSDGTANGSLDIGFYSGSSGTYNLNGGTLTAGYVRGNLGTSTFNFNGGTLTAGASATDFFQNLSYAYVGNGGAGIDTAGFDVTVAQNLAHSTAGGTTAIDGGLTKTGAGTLTLSGASTYTGATTVSVGTLAITGSVNSPNASLTVDGTGGTATTAATLSLSAASSSLNVVNAYVGVANAGTVNQSGGSLTVQNGLFLGNSLFSSGSYNLSGGSLSAGTVNVGYGGFGTLTQSGGGLTVTNDGSFYVGGSAGANGAADPEGMGSYTLSGSASTLATGILFVGYNGTGTFNQSGGVVTGSVGAVNPGLGAEGSLALGLDPGSSGTYNLSGGTFHATSSVFVGFEGSGTINHTGGTLNLDTYGRLFVGAYGGGGAYNLSGTGTLITSFIAVGDLGAGTFTQSGGSVAAAGGTLYVGYYNEGGRGTYNLSGGTLTTGVTQVSDDADTGTFNQTGGTDLTGTLSLTGYNAETPPNTAGSVGTYNLSGGTLNVGTVNSGTGGANGISTFNFGGGTLQAQGSTATFFQGLTTANVQAGGGAIIDTQGYSVTVAQALVHDPASGAPATDGGLTKLGSGTLTLTGANTYTGGTNFASGVLDAGSAGALGSTGALTFLGGTLQYSAANAADYSGRFSQAAGQAFVIDTNGQNVNYAAGLSSSGGSLTKFGAGTLTLAGASTYTSGTAVRGGTLALTGSVQSGGNAVLTVDGASALPATLILNGANSSLSTGTAFVGDAGTGTVAQNGGTLTTNDRTLHVGDLAGSAGTYNLGGGTLTAGAVQGDGSASTSTFNFGGGTLQAGGTAAGFFQGLTTANVQAGGGAVIDTQGYSVTVTQALVHDTANGAPATDGGLTKLGTGMLTLSGASTYTGQTQIRAGTLLVVNTAGSGTGTGAVTVNAGATLGGTGSLAGAVTARSGGTVAPGVAGPGALTLGSTLSLNAGSTLAIELGGTAAGSGYDQIVAGGRLTLGGDLSVSIVNGFALAANETFDILVDGGTSLVAGTFANAAGGTVYTDSRGDTFLVSYAANADGGAVGNDVSLTVINAVPEPASSVAMAAAGAAAGLGWWCGVARGRRGRWGRA